MTDERTSDARLPLGAKGEPPKYFDDSEVGKVLAMVVALTGEMAVMRDRLDTVERLLDSGKLVTRDAIERFAPDEKVRTERDAWRQEFLSQVFRVIHEERERMSSGSRSYEDEVKRVESEG